MVITLLLIVPLNSGANTIDITAPVNNYQSEMDIIEDLDFNQETEISNELRSTIDDTMSGFVGFRENPQDSDVKYILSSSQMDMGFSESKVQLRIPNYEEEYQIVSAHDQFDKMSSNIIGYTDVSLEFIGSNSVQPMAENPSTSYFNYFIGDDSEKWITNAPSFGKIVYANLYENIDLLYSIKGGQLKYDFYVYPGGNYEDIQLRWNGPVAIEQNDNGLNIEVSTDYGIISLTDSNPINFLGADHEEVFGIFRIIDESTYGFLIEDYDHSKVLIIDPLIKFSTFIGGSDPEYSSLIAVDGNGDVYIAATSGSYDFPTTKGAFDETKASYTDVVVLKLAANGSTLIFSTFIGGSGGYEFTGVDRVYAMVVDYTGNVYITGDTDATSFPITTGAYAVGYTAEIGGQDTFVTKLAANGSTLLFSGMIGGSSYDRGLAITFDVDNNVYIVGSSSSTDFPTTKDAYNEISPGLFACKFSSDFSSLLFSTIIGWGTPASISIDRRGDIYFVGDTTSSAYPTTIDAYNPTHGGSSDVFITMLAANFSTILYSTFIGGSDYDYCKSMVARHTLLGGKIDETSIYLTGSTRSINFPTTKDAFDETHNGGDDAFVLKFGFSLADTGLRYSTFIGGSENDYGSSVTIDSAGNTYITGDTVSTDYPTTDGSYDTNGGIDSFLTYLAANGSTLLYSTYIGGSGEDLGVSITLDIDKNIYIAGVTRSTDFLTTSESYDTEYSAGGDIFVIKLSLEPASPFNITSIIESNESINIIHLQWEMDNTSSNIEYFVYRGTTSGSYSFLTSTFLTQYNDSTILMNQDYYYVITAVNTFGESPNSIELHIYIQAPLTAPVNFIATAGAGHVYLSWDPPTEDGGVPIVRYNLYRGDFSGEVNVVFFVYTTDFNDTSVIGGSTYYYTVMAVNSNEEKAYGDEISATPNVGLTDVVTTTATTTVTTTESLPIQFSIFIMGFTTVIGARIIRRKKRTKLSKYYTNSQVSNINNNKKLRMQYRATKLHNSYST